MIIRCILGLFLAASGLSAAKPNIILVMADDMGWGETGYNGHPVLKTPNLDEMAANGLRFDRFYAGGPVCSPTRASVLTGRTPDRSGVESHGFALRKQEKTLPAALGAAGYATGHFGKWHLNGLRGPGVPVLKEDTHGPGRFGFERWLSVTNFFDLDPIMSRQGEFEEFTGDSSEIIVGEALKFVAEQAVAKKPSFTVIWYGSPHSPWLGLKRDLEAFPQLNEKSRQHYAELAALDRSIGTLRRGLRDLGVAEDTLVWFCSDNGGLPGFKPDTVGGLRGYKGSLYEGGLRVPAIIEWPGGIPKARVTLFPAATMDIFPTLAEIVGLPAEAMLQPQDGMSLKGLLGGELGKREIPICFRSNGRGAMIDNDLKLFGASIAKADYALYDLRDDPGEKVDIAAKERERAERLWSQFEAWNEGVEKSVAGKDYPEQAVETQPKPRLWSEEDAYRPYLESWAERSKGRGGRR